MYKTSIYVLSFETLETRAQKMYIPYQGIGICLFGEQPPDLLLSIEGGGLNFSYVPIREAFEKKSIQVELIRQNASEEMITEDKPPSYDIIRGKVKEKMVPAIFPKRDDECFLLLIKALINKRWEVIGNRLLPIRYTTALNFLKLCQSERSVNVHLMLGWRKQHIADYSIKFSKETLKPLSLIS